MVLDGNTNAQRNSHSETMRNLQCDFPSDLKLFWKTGKFRSVEISNLGNGMSRVSFLSVAIHEEVVSAGEGNSNMNEQLDVFQPLAGMDQQTPHTALCPVPSSPALFREPR
eukprot:2838160-Amphidinium_carterae.1